VNLDGAAAASGSGTVTLEFQPAVAGVTDSAIVFSTGAATLTFTYSAGDTQAHFGGQTAVQFQTGTTAGALIFTATIGATTVRQSIAFAAGPIGLSNVQGSRGPGSVTVQITAFDNTRTAGSLIFTFYDASGNPISPGGIVSDATKAFDGYFSTSSLGGIFLLNAVFPVTGDTSQIGSFDVQLANALASTKSARISF
jgi:hypothetical protein